MFFTVCDTRGPVDYTETPILEITCADPGDSVITYPFPATATQTYVSITAATLNADRGLLTNPVNVHFFTSSGAITGVATTTNGVATASFFPTEQNQVYSDSIWAFMAYNDSTDTVWASLKIRVLPAKNEPTSQVGDISLSAAPTSVQVLGTGGSEQSIITATVTDNLLNQVADGTPVFFQIFNGPGGGEALEKDTGYTDDGDAKVTFKSGASTGVVVILARCGAVTVQKSLITITSGPPSNISINPILTPVMLEEGSSQWIMFVQAKLTDANLNEVRDGWAVNFAVDSSFTYKRPGDTTTVATDLVGLSINTGSETGRRYATDADGAALPSLPGIAETYIKFPSTAIFDSIRFIASTKVGADSIRSTRIIGFPLPADGITLTVAKMPGTNVLLENNYDRDTAVIVATLMYGQAPIEGARIRIEAALGDLLITPRCNASGISVTDQAGTAEFKVLFMDKHRPNQADFAFTADMKVYVLDQSAITPQTVTLTVMFSYDGRQ